MKKEGECLGTCWAVWAHVRCLRNSHLLLSPLQLEWGQLSPSHQNVELLRALIWKSFGCASHDLEFSVGTGGWLTILALLLIFNQHSLVHH